MYYVLYDKNFNALGQRKTYPCSKWSIKHKANEFDEIEIGGLAIENDSGAMYVGLYDEYAKLNSLDTYNTNSLKIMGFCGIPTTTKGKTKIKAVDMRQILNNDAVIDLTNVKTVEDIYSELLTCIFDTSKHGYLNLGINVKPPELDQTKNIIFLEEAIERSKGKGNVWKTLQAVNSIYNCYVTIIVNVLEKSITFKVNLINKTINIKLADFTDTKLQRDTTGINRAVCYGSGNYENREVYYLLNDDTVVSENDVDINKILYPVNIEIFENEDINTAKAEAIKKLYENKYKAKVEIAIDNKLSLALKDIGLDYFVDVYEYKKLPVMEINEGSDGKKKIVLGRLEEYWWV